MVKRKANVSLDEWLAKRYSHAETTQGVVAAVEEEPVYVTEPVAEVIIEPTPVEPVATVTGEVAAQGEDNSSWFWELLALSGYERW